MAEPKILIWDIESTGLNADFGVMLCIGYKWYGQKKVHIIGIDDDKKNVCTKCKTHNGDDTSVAERFYPILEQADMQVSWYGKKFDEPLLRSRWLFNKGFGNIPPVFHVDLWETARKELKLSSNRLASVQSFLGLEDSKTAIDRQIWNRAGRGELAPLKYIKEHCRKDVLVLEQAYERLRPIIRVNRPNMRVIMGKDYACPTCGSGRLHRRGPRYTLNTKYYRFYCVNCGSWCSSPPTRMEATR
jgi:uncharacterized protein YprB with RNaseH-like and TPR domain